MNELQIFNNVEFGDVRMTEIDGKPYFVATDIAMALGYATPRDAIARHCKGVVKRDTPTSGGVQSLSYIGEGDLYRLIMKSKLPNAEKFESWVMDEVLPSIRKHGVYAVDELLDNPELAIKAFTALKEEREKNKALQADNERMKPKEEFFDAVADSKTAISMNEVAKVLSIKGYGRNNLFEFLRSHNILDRFNVPYQKYVDNGWFRVIEQHYQKNGEPVVTTKTLVYQKGVDGIRKKILAQAQQQKGD